MNMRNEMDFNLSNYSINNPGDYGVFEGLANDTSTTVGTLCDNLSSSLEDLADGEILSACSGVIGTAGSLACGVIETGCGFITNTIDSISDFFGFDD